MSDAFDESAKFHSPLYSENGFIVRRLLAFPAKGRSKPLCKGGERGATAVGFGNRRNPGKKKIAGILPENGHKPIDGQNVETNRLWSPRVMTTSCSGQQPVNKF